MCIKKSDIYNSIAATRKHWNEIMHRILRAFPKLGKRKGPTSNLQLIILLFIPRKILAVCIMKRINSRLYSVIPISQAAYHKNRSTTKFVFATKLIIERTISSTDETVYLLLLDMSKVFNSIQRNTLMTSKMSWIKTNCIWSKFFLMLKLQSNVVTTKVDFSAWTQHLKEIVQVPVSLFFT